MTIWVYPRDGFTESKIVVSWRKVTYSCYSSSACLFREFSRGLMVSVSFRRLWPLRCQLQWLIGGSEMWVRLSYITCNSCIVSRLFLKRNIAQTNYTVAVTVRCFGAFVAEYCCSDSLIVKLFILCDCCSDSFGENWQILIYQFYLYSSFGEKKLFFFQCIGMLTLWLDDRWLVHMDTQVSDGVAIDGLVNGVSLVFTMLRTYTSSKSGLSARKSESNSGDATISLRMVNKDTSRTCITLLCTFTH